MTTALVIGAGPGGLTAARELGKLGICATVVEADEIVGGLARTLSHRGYRFDIGGHRFFSKVPMINELCREILGDELLLRPRLSRIYYRGRFFDYPLKPLNALRGLGPLEATRVLMSYAGSKIRPAIEESSFEDWVANRFGRRLYETFFKTYTEKVWGIPCAEISADWAAQRIKNLSLGEALRAALLRGRNGSADVVTSLIEQFHYPLHGPGMMWERCAGLVRRDGGEVFCGKRVECLHHGAGRIDRIDCIDKQGNRTEYAPDHVISTMALRDLIRALDPPPPDEVRRAAESLRYRDYLTVILIVKRENVFPDNWIYIHEPGTKLGRIQNYKNWSSAMVPDPSRTSLGLEYFLWEHDEEWSWPTERLIEEGIRDCTRIGILTRDEVEDATVVHAPKAYPVYDQSYRSHVDVVRRWLAGFENLQTVGRNGQHRYNNQDHSMLAGVFAARNVAGACHDVWSVNTDASYHEETRSSAGDRSAPSRLTPPEAADRVVGRVLERIDPVALGAAFAVVSGIGIFAAIAVPLLRGVPHTAPDLSLLGQYLLGVRVSWVGACLAFAEVALTSFVLGYASAILRNRALLAYTDRFRRRAAAKLRSRFLDEV